MEMDDAAGTITQILSVGDRTRTPYESVRPASRIRSRQLYHANIFAPHDRAKPPDYIEVILHCKGVSRSLIRRASIVLVLISTLLTDRIDRDSHSLFRGTARRTSRS